MDSISCRKFPAYLLVKKNGDGACFAGAKHELSFLRGNSGRMGVLQGLRFLESPSILIKTLGCLGIFMANMILTVIAVALVAIIVVVGVFYGGMMFSSYQAEAQASRLISEAEQIAGTVSMYANEQHELPTYLTALVEKDYFMETPAKGVNTRWKLSKGYAVNAIGSGTPIHQSCLSARKRWGFDAEKYCADAEAAGCSPSSNVAPEGCNKHCMRTCYDPEDMSRWNPQLNQDDPCCIDNSQDTSIADPVFP